jgi:hypothetical protein
MIAAVSGCAYTTKNGLPPHLKSIAIPVFTNKSYYHDYTRKIEVEVSDAVRKTFVQTGELKLAGREDADLILEGDVTGIDREVLRADRFGDPAEVRYVVRSRISLYDVKEAKYLLKNVLVTSADNKGESGVYSLRRGESEDTGRERAVEDLGRLIARHVVEKW